MHMEAVQKYVVSMSEHEAKALYKEISTVLSGAYVDKPQLAELHEKLGSWFAFDKNQ